MPNQDADPGEAAEPLTSRRVGWTTPLSTLDRLPTSSVQWNAEEPAQDALAAKDFKKWRAATGWNAADVCDAAGRGCRLAGPS